MEIGLTGFYLQESESRGLNTYEHHTFTFLLTIMLLAVDLSHKVLTSQKTNTKTNFLCQSIYFPLFYACCLVTADK